MEEEIPMTITHLIQGLGDVLDVTTPLVFPSFPASLNPPFLACFCHGWTIGCDHVAECSSGVFKSISYLILGTPCYLKS